MDGILIWRDSLSLGDALVDSHHRRLLDTINALANNRLLQSITSEEFHVRTLEELRAYAKDHFEVEEQLLIDSGYPKVRSHKLQHGVFMAKIEVLSKHQGSVLFIMDTLRFLADWLEHHMLVVDMDCKNYVQEYKDRVAQCENVNTTQAG